MNETFSAVQALRRALFIIEFNIGINHDFQCSDNRWIAGKVFGHKAEVILVIQRIFEHLSKIWSIAVLAFSHEFTQNLENYIKNVKNH